MGGKRPAQRCDCSTEHGLLRWEPLLPALWVLGFVAVAQKQARRWAGPGERKALLKNMVIMVVVIVSFTYWSDWYSIFPMTLQKKKEGAFEFRS